MTINRQNTLRKQIHRSNTVALVQHRGNLLTFPSAYGDDLLNLDRILREISQIIEVRMTPDMTATVKCPEGWCSTGWKPSK